MTVDPDNYVFQPWPKIPRLKRDIVITEKIDGTNAQVYVADDGAVLAGSRTRWLTPGKSTDNFGFAAWVQAHEDELREGLGVGRHFGEWWGQGIQRGYGLEEKRFSLFNTHRYGARNGGTTPACCDVVPELYHGPWSNDAIEECLTSLRAYGSRCAPGWEGVPEGVVVYHAASGGLFKVLLEHDELPKGVTTRKERDELERVLKAAA